MTQSSFWIVYFVIAIVALVINVALSILVGNMAAKKGYSKGGFFAISFFLSFILGLIIVLVISPKPESQMTLTTSVAGLSVGPVQCAFCRELVRPDAVVCKHCGKDIEPAITAEALSPEAQAKLAFVTKPAEIKRQVTEQNPALARKGRFLNIALLGELVILLIVIFLDQTTIFIGLLVVLATVITAVFQTRTEKELKLLGEELKVKLANEVLKKS